MPKRILNYLKNIILPGFLVSGIVGIIVGIIITLYKFIVDYVIHSSKEMYIAFYEKPFLIPLCILALLLLSLLSSILAKDNPSVKGGGIAVSEGTIRGNLDYFWPKTLLYTIFLSLLNFFIGLPFGTEGPSVQIGTSISYGINSLFNKKNMAWKKYIMTGGASAAFGVATGCPITGIIFSLEEIHRKFSPMIILVSFSAVLTSNITAYYFCSLLNMRYSFFDTFVIERMPLSKIPYMVLFGLIIGLFAILLNKIIVLSIKIFEKKMSKIPLWIKLFISFLLTFIVCFFFNDLLGGGHELIDNILENNYKLGLLFVFLLLKFILFPICSSSGATGGLFIPQLLFGALIGAIFAKIFNLDEYYVLFVFAGMASFMSASVGCPLSGLVFSVESLSCINNVIPVGIAIIISYIITLITSTTHVYDLFLEKKYRELYRGKHYEVIEFEAFVLEGSFAESKQTRDLLFSGNIIILSIIRKENIDRHEKMDNSGDKRLHIGDSIIFRCQTYNITETKKEICDFVGVQAIDYKIISEYN